MSFPRTDLKDLILVEAYENFLPYIDDPKGVHRYCTTMYDSTGFYSMVIERPHELNHEEAYKTIREKGVKEGVYDLAIYHLEKVSDRDYKILFFIAGRGIALPPVKKN